MSKGVSKHKPAERELILKTLYRATDAMGDKDAATKFVKELLTESEQLTVGRRLLIAQMILQGKSQAEIRFELDVSPNTFTRTRKWLNKQLPKYDEALKDYQSQVSARQASKQKKSREPMDPFSFEALRRKYPAHFLLVNVIAELTKKS